MKKVLFATTALVASASIASAEVTLSGFAEMGVFGGGFSDADLQFHTDIDITFTLTGETDGGLTFGANVDLDESDGNDSQGNSPTFDNDTQGGESIFVSGSLGTLTMGDTDGALDWAMQEVGILDSINDDHTEHAGFNANSGLDGTYDGQVARYDYTFGDFSFALSAEILDDRDDDDDDDDIDDDAVLGVGFKYSTEFAGTALGFGLAYQTNDDNDILAVSADANFDFGLRAIINYSDFDDGNHLGVGLGYELAGIGLAANYGRYDLDDGDDSEGFGIAANYDLGGGAVLQAGYGRNIDDDDEDDADDSYSFGIAMSF